MTLFNENRKYIEGQKDFEKEITELKAKIAELEETIETEKDKNTEEYKVLEKKNAQLKEEREAIENHLKSVQIDYNTTKVNLGTT